MQQLEDVFSVPAERSVIGSMVLSPDCIGRVSEKLSDKDFGDEATGALFGFMQQFWISSPDAFDLVLLRNFIEGKSADWKKYIEIAQSCAMTTPSAANVDYYVGIVKSKSSERELMAAVDKICQQSRDNSLSLDEKRMSLEQATLELNTQVAGTATPISTEMMSVLSAGTSEDGITCGFRNIDYYIRGLNKGEMIILAARPSMGKSALMLCMAMETAKHDNPTVVFSMEMSKSSLAERMISMVSSTDMGSIRKNFVSQERLAQMYQEIAPVANSPLYIDDSAMLSPSAIATRLIRYKKQWNIKVAFIDYLQLMYLGTKIENRQQEVSKISSELKALAKRLEIPIVVLSQLNRGVEYRADHRPKLSDLRESGSIEQDADVVLLLHREDYYRKGEQDYRETGESLCIVAKNRNGPTGDGRLLFIPEHVSFKDMANI